VSLASALRTLLVLASLAGGASAQVLSIPARADRVLLSATAVDDRGRPVQDLKLSEFRIYEEG
jgi:hypothetical protein